MCVARRFVEMGDHCGTGTPVFIESYILRQKIILLHYLSEFFSLIVLSVIFCGVRVFVINLPFNNQ